MNRPERRVDAPEHRFRERGMRAPNGLAWIVAGGAVVLVIIALAFGVRSLGNGDRPTEVSRVFSPIIGGLRLSSAEDEATVAPVAPVVMTPVASIPGSSPALEWEAGRTATAKAEVVRLHADADPNSTLLDTYARGATFEVMEPSGDYEGYPVRFGSGAWVRLRAEDGLVGWANISDLSLMP
jgi:hypothetical protein